MTLPAEIRDAAALFRGAPPELVHRAMLGLARLVLVEAPPQAASQLELAERFLRSEASAAELASAKADVWAYIGSLACYCTPSDSASSQAVLACLETDPSQHGEAALLEQAERVARCHIPAERICATLVDAARRR